MYQMDDVPLETVGPTEPVIIATGEYYTPPPSAMGEYFTPPPSAMGEYFTPLGQTDRDTPFETKLTRAMLGGAFVAGVIAVDQMRGKTDIYTPIWVGAIAATMIYVL